ncbi:MAG TPA: XRE family transcriptional regulator [Casimicrobium huifangae]|jgi:hypothetical protein|uniref:XRE family transcriptional regulator n=1 Tax=Casimicrobium huifangae TaxID=2591109 RepID=UPI0012EB9752|nr:XRE family transcriptional regulator [Casimicrobium huifangae]HOB02786.1 XRE family transcriptional regulator [Casimicrobium huifangae]HQA35037.1 XRE family transcriptional regulator [Casimicrobium huifangae]HQD65572.1 XRE family transcriptional regulator [Casimicrobium huifangae]
MDKDAKADKALFAERLRRAMIGAGLEPKAAVLERGFNQNFYGEPMTLHGVARWLKGETVPPYAKVVALAKWLKVPVENLYGAGGRHAAEEARPKFGPEIGYQERELFEAFLKLPAPQRRIVREIIVAFSKSVGQ